MRSILEGSGTGVRVSSVIVPPIEVRSLFESMFKTIENDLCSNKESVGGHYRDTAGVEKPVQILDAHLFPCPKMTTVRCITICRVIW